jgi:bisanhydrobacterioruberin hydratase
MKKFYAWLAAHKESIAIYLTVFFLLAGVLQYMIGWDYILTLTTLVISIITALVVLFWQIDHKQRLIVALVAISIGMASEIIGVNTGILFGDYSYSSTSLGLKIFGVPLLVGIMWLLVTASAWQIALLGGFSKRATVVLASFITVIFDLLLEQYATAYGLWAWQGGVIPLLNYLTWFFVSMIIFIVFSFVIKQNYISKYGIAAIPLMMLYFWLMLIFT